MKIETKIISCDFCQRVLYLEKDGRKDDFLNNLLTKVSLESSSGKKVTGEFCSLQCFVIGAWKSIREAEPTTFDAVKYLKEVLPEWVIEPPNYKKMFEDGLIAQAQEIIKEVKGYEVIKKGKNTYPNP